jgi:hypothetical protein
MQPNRHCHPHHQLWVGYALIVAVIVLMVLAVNSAMQAKALRLKTTDLDGRIGTLKTEHEKAVRLLSSQMSENSRQDSMLAAQARAAEQQREAIARLARLRRQDATALTGLHNELAVRFTDDARVKQRLQQLEANNAAARTLINTTPAPIDTKAHP